MSCWNEKRLWMLLVRDCMILVLKKIIRSLPRHNNWAGFSSVTKIYLPPLTD